MSARPTASLHLNAGREFRATQRRVLYLLQGLAARGHRVLLCCPRTSALFRRAGAAGIPCAALTLRSSLDFPSIVRLARLVRDERFDLVHAHDSQSHHVARAARGMSGERALTANLFLTHHELADGGNAGARVHYDDPGVHYIASCKPVRDGLVQRGADAARIAVVPDGVDVPALRLATRPSTDPWGLRARGLRIVGTVLRSGKEKNLMPLLEAFAFLHRRLPDTHVLVAGKASPALERGCRDLGIGAAVTFTGVFDDAASVHAAAHVFAYLSDPEGTATTLLEAMAAGTPVVTTAVPSVLGIVRHGTSALVVPPRDNQALAQALELVLAQPELAARLVHGAATVAEQHSVERMVDATLGAYRSLGQLEAARPDSPRP